MKPLSTAKTRLGVAGLSNAQIATAFLTDVLSALRGARLIDRVVVATSDTAVRATARAHGADAFDDSGHAGINPAIRATVRDHPVPGPVCALVSDLPCLTSTVMDRVLARAAAFPVSFVADAAGTGTTMWLARDGGAVGPHFGADSRNAHRAHGARDLIADLVAATGPWLPARLDVDTAADLDRARTIGLGASSTALLTDPGVPDPHTILTGVDDALGETIVRSVDEAGRVGEASVRRLAGPPWRRLEPGQRVWITPPDAPRARTVASGPSGSC